MTYPRVSPPIRAALVGLDGSAAVTLTDQSIESATGSSQAVLAANPARRSLTWVNIALTPWTINPLGGTAAAGITPCFTLEPGEAWTPQPPPANEMTAIGTAGSKLTVLEG